MQKKLAKATAAIATLLTPVATFAVNQAQNVPTTPIVHPNNSGDIQSIAQTVISFLLVLSGALAVIFLIIGGIRYLVSAGDSSQIEKAKHTIQYAIIGLIVIIFAYVIVNSVINGTKIAG